MACQIFLNAKNALMDEMKSSIRKFLALTKMTRDEFADLCGVSKSQVDKWLSTVPIPPCQTTPYHQNHEGRVRQTGTPGSNKKSEQHPRSRYSSKV